MCGPLKGDLSVSITKAAVYLEVIKVNRHAWGSSTPRSLGVFLDARRRNALSQSSGGSITVG